MVEHIALALAVVASIALAINNRRLRKEIAPFDGDHDGHIGGSRKRS